MINEHVKQLGFFFLAGTEKQLFSTHSSTAWYPPNDCDVKCFELFVGKALDIIIITEAYLEA